LTAYARRALADIRALRNHYVSKRRPEAIRALNASLAEAEARIARSPGAGLAAPRPYPALASAGSLWILVGRYWIAYRPSDPPLILAVFYDQADIPRRL
jgi:plasmid stabilization system protein ParE